MPPAGFQPTNPASERSQTYVLDRVAIRISTRFPQYNIKNRVLLNSQHIQQGSSLYSLRYEFLVWSKLPPTQSPPSHASPTKQKKNNEEGATNTRRKA